MTWLDLEIINQGVEACLAEWLTPQTVDLGVQGLSLTPCVVSLDKEL